MVSFPGGRPPARTRLLIGLALCLPASAGLAAGEYRELEILGWVENVWLKDPGFKMRAKLDTGAETSSLHAVIVKKFRKGGKRWVRFEVEDPASGERTTLVRERVRTIGIIQHAGDNQTRPTVIMQICVAGRTLETEVSLIDRSQFNYPLLLGRNTLQGFALIDPGNTFLSNESCKAIADGEPTA